MRHDQWFAAFEDGKKSTLVVGRFIDGEVVDPIESGKKGKNVWKTVPLLESKIVGSHDVSTQRVKEDNLKDGIKGNKEELMNRFPGAWDHYVAQKDVVDEPSAPLANSGTPIEELDFIPRQNIAWLRELGFSSAEQIRDMSDTVVQGLGRGALNWRKKAKEFLERT